MEYRLEHIRAGIQTANGRTYSKAILQMMVDDARPAMIAGELLIREPPSPGDLASGIFSGEILGAVTELIFDGECLMVDAEPMDDQQLPDAIDLSALGTMHQEGEVLAIEKLEYFYAADPNQLIDPLSKEPRP